MNRYQDKLTQVMNDIIYEGGQGLQVHLNEDDETLQQFMAEIEEEDQIGKDERIEAMLADLRLDTDQVR